jgi:hypothetical protein
MITQLSQIGKVNSTEISLVLRKFSKFKVQNSNGKILYKKGIQKQITKTFIENKQIN